MARRLFHPNNLICTKKKISSDQKCEEAFSIISMCPLYLLTRNLFIKGPFKKRKTGKNPWFGLLIIYYQTRPISKKIGKSYYAYDYGSQILHKTNFGKFIIYS